MSKSAHKNLQLAGTATVGPKGQVVIPHEVRQQMSIVPGDKLVVLYMPDKQAVGLVSEATLQAMIDKMGSNLDSLKSALSK